MKSAQRQRPREAAPPQRATNFFAQGSIIFLVAATIRLVHIWQIRHAPFFDVLLGDARGYDDWAQQLAAGDWVGKDVFFQAPLYPYFLGVVYATFGHSLLVVRLCQTMIGASASVLLGLAARRVFTPRIGLIAGLGLALYAPAIFFDGLIQKSVLDVFFVCLSLWILSGLIDRPGRALSWLCLGLAMGGLSLTRENALVVIAVIVVWGLVRLRRDPPKAFASLASFILGLALALLPVVVHNYAASGGFYLTTWQFGNNLYIGNNPGADGTYKPLRYGRVAPEYERQDITDLAERAMGRKLTPAEVSSYWTRRATDFVTSQPLAWLKLMGRKFVLLWNATEAVDTESQETYAEWSTPLAIGERVSHFGILMPLALLGFCAAWPERKRLWVFYALTAAYSASVLIFYVFARYRFPLIPLLMLFAARGLVAIPEFVRDIRGVRPKPKATKTSQPNATAGRGRREAFAVFVAVAAAAIFANWAVLSVSAMQAVTENNLGVALEKRGRLDEATAHYQRATVLDPGYAPAYNNLATALRAKGDVDRAVAAYERALAMQPDYPDAHYNLGNALLQENRTDEAIAQFRIALAATPGSVDIENNLGTALIRAGKVNEGVVELEKALTANPDLLSAHRNLADALTLLGRNDEAIVHLRRAAEISPRDGSIHYDLGSTLLALRRVPDAIGELRQAIALLPGSVEAHNDLGVALMRERQVDDAIAEFQQALKLKPDYQEAAENLAAAAHMPHAQKPR